MESRKKYLVKNTILFAISSFGSKLISFFLVPLYTNVLSTADYGTVDLITTTSSLLLFVFSLNITSSVLRYAIDDEENRESILGYGFKVFGVGALILGTLIVVFSYFNLVQWGTQEYIFLFLIYIVTGIFDIVSNYLRAIDKVKIMVMASLSTTLVIVLSNIVLLIYFKMGLVGYLTSSVLGNTVGCFVSLCAIKSFRFVHNELPKNIKSEMLKYSIPLIFNGIAWWMNASIDKYFIVAMLGASSNGIYAVASKIPSILSMVLTIFMQAWNLSAIREYKSEDRDTFYSESYNLINAVLIVGASVLILMNILLSELLLKKEFFVAWQYSSILLLSGVFSGMGSFVGSIFSAAKKSMIFAVSTVAAAIVNLVLNYLTIPIWGLYGAAIATAVSFLIIWIVRLVCASKFVKLRIAWIRHLISYALIVAQIFLEHTDSHLYGFQIVILVALLVINIKEILVLVRSVANMLKSIFERNSNNEC